jgi:hypothetical protein
LRKAASLLHFSRKNAIKLRPTEGKYNKACAKPKAAIRIQDFTDKKPGRLIKPLREQYWAFVPGPLLPSLTPSWELVKQLSEADRALSELAGIARNLPSPHLLIDPFKRPDRSTLARSKST